MGRVDRAGMCALATVVGVVVGDVAWRVVEGVLEWHIDGVLRVGMEKAGRGGLEGGWLKEHKV